MGWDMYSRGEEAGWECKSNFLRLLKCHLAHVFLIVALLRFGDCLFNLASSFHSMGYKWVDANTPPDAR
eukprot:1136720-Amphidinium_carterae.1